MPTKKKRVGFIPRSDVLALINKLSYESNLSYSKIINILVEEALYKRGMFHKETENAFYEFRDSNDNIRQMKKGVINNEINYNFKNKLPKEENLIFNEAQEESLDEEIYSKFIMFLQFQEKMKNRDKLN